MPLPEEVDVVEVTLLGPPRVVRDGALVGFDTRKAVALLAYLALSEGSRSRDHLAGVFWPEADPEKARGALRRTLSSLRAGVGTAYVEATRDHVRLVRGAGLDVDVDRFRALRARGALAEAAEVGGGTLLEGFVVRDAPDFEGWLDHEAEVLRGELAATLESLVGQREGSGDLAGAISAARRWVGLDPLHEPAHQALIRLHTAAGDRASALRQFRDCVRVLSRELGVPPLSATTALHDAALAGTDPPPSVPAPVTAVVAPVDEPDADHGADLARVLDLVGQVTSGGGAQGAVVLVEGATGPGGTPLVRQLGAALTGTPLLVGRGYPNESALAYGPVIDVLRDRLARDDRWVASLDDEALAEAGRLLPELVAGRGLPAVGGPDEPGAESRFLAALWRTLVAAAGPGVLALEDAQWADEATLRLLAYGVRRLRGRPLVVVLSWRDPHHHPTWQAARQQVEDGHGVHLVLAEEGPSDRAEDWSAPAVRARLRPLSEQARQVLAAAVVLGGAFEPDEVRTVSGRSHDETSDALVELTAAGVLRRVAGGHDVAHQPVRDVVHEDTSLARRRLLHGRAADGLALPPAVLGRHLRLAGREEAAARAYAEAGERARSVFAHDEALGHLEAALGLGHPDRVGLLCEVAEVEVVLGDYAAALDRLRTAAAEADPGRLADVEHRLGRLRQRRGEYALAEGHLTTALAEAPDGGPGWRATVLADLSLALLAQEDLGGAGEAAQQSAGLARTADEPVALCRAENVLGMVAARGGDLSAALEHLGRSLDLARSAPAHDLEIAALNNLALVQRDRGDLPEALRLARQALERCTAVGDRHREAALHNNLADLLHAEGQGEDAMAHLKTAVRIFADIGVEEQPRAGIWMLVRW